MTDANNKENVNSEQDKEMEALGFKAEDYWHEKHGETGRWDYNRDDIENAWLAGWKAASERKEETSAYHHESMRLVAEAKLHLCELKLAQAEAEILEQCRLNGMGAQRELALMTKLAIAVEALEQYTEIAGKDCKGPSMYSAAAEALAKIKDK